MLVMLGLLAGKAPNRNQLMLMTLDAWAGRPKQKPTNAHDAGPFGEEGPNRKQMMLMMLGLLAGKARKQTSSFA